MAIDGGGVAYWDAENDAFVVPELQIAGQPAEPPQFVRSLVICDDGLLWLGTRGEGLWRIDPITGEAVVYRAAPDEPGALGNNDVFALTFDPDGQLWVGTEGGLYRLDRETGRFSEFRMSEDDPSAGPGDDRIRALLVDSAGTLWIGTYGGGVTHRGSDGQFQTLRADESDPEALPHDRVRSLFEDRDGRLWIGTAGGLCLLDRATERCDVYDSNPGQAKSLQDSDVMAIAQDRSGLLWFGTRSGGLHRWHPDSWRFGHVAPSADGLSHGTVTGFTEDSAGRIWIATLGGGLNRLDTRTGEIRSWRQDPEDPASLPSNFLASLLADPDGSLWLGTFDRGLLHLASDATLLQAYAPDPESPDALGAEGVTSLLRDDRGRLWAGTFGGGLHRLNPDRGTFRRYGTEDGLSSERVISLAQGSDGRIWIGTDAGGLNALDPETGSVETFPIDRTGAAGLPADTIFSIYGGDPDALWIGTRGAGLVRLDLAAAAAGSAVFESISEMQGLANDVIYGIRPDDAGGLWLSSNAGLSRYDLATGAIRNFFESDGLQAGEFTFGGHYRAGDGTLYFGGVNGFNAFDPADIETSSFAPPIALTGLSLLGQPASELGPAHALESLELGYRDDVVTLAFASLDFLDPRRNRYAYRIEGLHDDWIDIGPHRRVTFTDLDGGDYTLRVRATNHDGIWLDDAFVLPVSVAAPPWKTGLAYTIYVLAILAALAGWQLMQRRRLAREEAYSRELETEVGRRTGELRERNDQLEQLNAQLREASLTDALTGLRNRRFLAEHISEETSLVTRRYSKLADGVERIRVFDLVFIIIDLDGFKNINDTCGHLAGDEILMQMRDLLETVLRESDILVRWGGDEFLIVARDASPERGSDIAERVCATLRGNVFTLGDGESVRLTCSVGFACFPFVRDEPGLFSWSDILMFADTALYAAKASGRDGWVGLLSTEQSAMPELPARVRRDTAAAVEDGLVATVTSLEDKGALKWT